MKRISFVHLLMIALFFACCNEQADKKAEQEEPAAAVAVKPPGLNKLNYMRLSAGKFISWAPDKVPVTTREELSKTFDHLIENDSELVVYFHGGLIPIQMAYRDPIKNGFDSTVRSAKKFPYYILYGGGPGNIVWTYINSFFGEKDSTDANALMEEQNPLDSAIAAGFQRKSFLYLMIQLNRKFSPGATRQSLIDSTFYISDTANLERILKEEIELAKGNVMNLEQNLEQSLEQNDFLTNKKLQNDFEKALYADPYFQDLSRKDLSEEQRLEAKNVLPVNYAKLIYDIGKITVEIINRVVKRRHHGGIMTLAEEILLNSSNIYLKGIKTIAQQGWGQLKEDVELPFKGSGDKYGGTALLDEIVTWDSINRSKGKPKKIYLIGSSTGAVMICHLLKESDKKKYRHLSFNIIFSVPACSFRLFAEALDKSEKRIESFRLFALSDEDEKKAGWTIPYPGTILYFVSGICEYKGNDLHDELIVGMQRFYRDDFIDRAKLSSQQKNDIQRVSRFFNLVDGKGKNAVWSHEACPDPNLKNTAKRHTGVIRNTEVQNSIYYLLTH